MSIDHAWEQEMREKAAKPIKGKAVIAHTTTNHIVINIAPDENTFTPSQARAVAEAILRRVQRCGGTVSMQHLDDEHDRDDDLDDEVDLDGFDDDDFDEDGDDD